MKKSSDSGLWASAAFGWAIGNSIGNIFKTVADTAANVAEAVRPTVPVQRPSTTLYAPSRFGNSNNYEATTELSALAHPVERPNRNMDAEEFQRLDRINRLAHSGERPNGSMDAEEFHRLDRINRLPHSGERPNLSVNIEEIWTDYSARENGEEGICIHTRLGVESLISERLAVVALFCHDNSEGESVKTSAQGYHFDGNLHVYKELCPIYRSTLYEDCKLFLPYRTFNDLGSGTGKWSLKFDVSVVGLGAEKTTYAESNWQYFTCDMGSGVRPLMAQESPNPRNSL